MNIDTDQGVTEALREVLSWYSQDRTIETGAIDPIEVRGRRSPTMETGLRPRLALVAVILLASVGAVGLVRGRSSTDVAPAGLGAALERAMVVDLCLDIDSGYDLDELAATGTLHMFGEPNSGQVPLIISSGALHVACGLAQRDNGEWFRVVSLAGTHLPLASSEDVSVLFAVELKDRTYVGGQVGPGIDTIEVGRPDGDYGGQIDDGWWGVSFDSIDDRSLPFPPFSVRSTTTAGDIKTAQGSDLLSPKPWNLCARDTTCRNERLIELQELAKGGESIEQAAILADGIVTEDEYRSALRTWGECIAQSTSAEVTFDEGGLFTIDESGDHIEGAFERCKESHIALVIEALGLAGATNS